jgi:septum formation protein
MTAKTLLLASQSPRRLQLLLQVAQPLGLCVQTCGFDPSIDPESLEAQVPDESPKAYVVRVTQNKARAAWTSRVSLGLPLHPLVTGDTTVSLDEEIFGKPRDEAHAAAMLNRLSGRTHSVYTAVGIHTAASYQWALSHSLVTFADLPQDWIHWVIKTGEPFGKAGAYAIQGHAGMMIQSINGSPSGIMGLPLFETTQLLKAALATHHG